MLFAALSFLGLLMIAVGALCADIERTHTQPAGVDAGHGHGGTEVVRVIVLIGLVLAFVGALAAIGSAR